MSVGELFDTHAHLHFSEFSADLDTVLARARAAVALAEREPDVWASVGIHPHEAASADDAALSELERLADQRHLGLVREVCEDGHPRGPRRALLEAIASR